MPGTPSTWWKSRSLLAGVFSGALYGAFLRGAFGLLSRVLSAHGVPVGYTVWVMSISFLALVPFVIGCITIVEADPSGQRSVLVWFFLPWLPTLLACGIAILFRMEGWVCLVFAIPITLLSSSLGGGAAGEYTKRRGRIRQSRLVSVALLPFLLAPVESILPAPIQTRTVRSEIRIHAPVPVIWHNIERVPAIAPTELRPTWPQRIGFPRPVAATLSFEGVGGVRHATFEHGLLFLETVNAWEPDHRLAFSIHADTAHIPPTTLDEHVTIGGRYFDVLDGEYRLEPLSGGETLLHLTSHQRLSTDFNGYAGLWSDAVMQSLQSSILEVIRHRCETRAVAQSTPPTP